MARSPFPGYGIRGWSCGKSGPGTDAVYLNAAVQGVGAKYDGSFGRGDAVFHPLPLGSSPHRARSPDNLILLGLGVLIPHAVPVEIARPLCHSAIVVAVGGFRHGPT